MKLSGKRAFITGGSSGIGLATAKRFVEEGARVAITGRDQKRLDAAVQEIGGDAIALAADASDIAANQSAVEQAAGRFGGLDVVFANAGIAGRTAMGDTKLDVFEEIFRTNVTGVYFTVQAAAPHLSDGASIVLNGSVHAVMGAPGSAAYAASKAAVRSLARSIASELAPRRIRANVVVPGATRTSIWDARAPNPQAMAALEERFGRTIPLGRMVEADEIARAVVFLASDDSSMITGGELVVDGGTTQNPYGAKILQF
jgi:NAD(P)-dependent dehydrogenase (short-subunit alcohol dehydrogenase family)